MTNEEYERVEKFYLKLGEFFPYYEENPCAECNICCKEISNLGVSALEKDYIKEYIIRKKLNLNVYEKFVNFLLEIKNKKDGQKCPFFDESLKGCSIYDARPLSCRTFGCYINETYKRLIPDVCKIKNNLIVYDDSDFYLKAPFIVEFYKLITLYEKNKKKSQALKRA